MRGSRKSRPPRPADRRGDSANTTRRVRVTRHGTADGLSTAQCTYTITKGLVLRICTVDYALANGLIVTSGYIDGPGKGAPVTLVVDGGTGAFKNARGYGHLQPTSTGSNVTLYLTG